MEQTEPNRRVLVDLFEGLYLPGEKDALPKLMRLFSEEDYRIRCAVLHGLLELLNRENQEEIGQFLEQIEGTDHQGAVADTPAKLCNALHELTVEDPLFSTPSHCDA